MNERTRFVMHALLAALVSAGVCLLLLTLVDRQLDRENVLRFDLGVQAAVHAWANPLLTRLMLALTWLGSIRIFGTSLALVLGWLVWRRRGHAAVLLFCSILGAFTLNETLKLHFHRARPKVPWSIGDEHTFSFPSGHSLFAVVFYGTLALLALHPSVSLRRRLEVLVPACVMPLGIGLSRIYLGMHYPTDVAAGWLTGAVWLAAVIAVDRMWHRAEAQAGGAG